MMSDKQHRLVTKHLTLDTGYVVEYRVYEDEQKEDIDEWFKGMLSTS